MNWIEVNGTVLRYELCQGTPEPKGPTLVLIHEMGGSLESWDALCECQPSGTQVLRYDTRSAGLSAKVLGELSIDAHAEDLHGLLAALGIEGPVAVVGVAVGAAIAIHFAARYPERTSHLIGMAPACGVPADARGATRARAAALRAEGLETLLPVLLEKTWPLALRTAPQVYEQFRLRWLTADPEGFAATFAMLAGLDLDADLPKLPPRTLLVAGQYDALRPMAEIERLAALCPHSEAIQVASGHFMPLQSPRLVAALVSQYIYGELSAQAIYARFMEQPDHCIGPAEHAA